MYNNSRENHGIKSICYISRSPQGKRRKSEKPAKNYTRRYFVIIVSRRSIGRSHSNLTIFAVSKICLSSFERNIVGGIPKWNSVMSILFLFFFLFYFFISINSHRLLLVVKYLIIISYLVRLRPKEHLGFFFVSILFVYTLISQLNI